MLFAAVSFDERASYEPVGAAVGAVTHAAMCLALMILLLLHGKQHICPTALRLRTNMHLPGEGWRPPPGPPLVVTRRRPGTVWCRHSVSTSVSEKRCSGERSRHTQT